MAELITLKLEKKFLNEIDAVLAGANYHSRTEFIREAMRDKLEQIRTVHAHIERLRGSSKRKVSDEEYERVRSNVPEILPSEELLRLTR